MRIRTLLALCVLLGSPVLAAAQRAQLKLPSFDHLVTKAIESADITIGAWPLVLAARFMDESDVTILNIVGPSTSISWRHFGLPELSRVTN